MKCTICQVAQVFKDFVEDFLPPEEFEDTNYVYWAEKVAEILISHAEQGVLEKDGETLPGIFLTYNQLHIDLEGGVNDSKRESI
jgi:hypothetical protein